MKNVYLFWIGDKNKISPLTSKLSNLGLKVFVGPSDEDHKFLYDNYDYYRKSFDLKIWSFCSDIWRLYILSRNKGLYIDTSVVIGDDFLEFYKAIENNDVALFKQSSDLVASAIMGSGKTENSFFKWILEAYDKEMIYNPRFYQIMPNILTVKLFEIGLQRDCYDEEILRDAFNNNIYIYSLLSIRDESRIKKIGSGSWMVNYKGSGNYDDTWEGTEKNWIARHSSKWDIRNNNILINNGILSLSAANIRDTYDFAKNAKDRDLAVSAFKSIKYKKQFSELLIWSRLFVFFTFKWIKKKR